MRLFKFLIVVLVFVSISFFVANCEKELIPVPEDEKFDQQLVYDGSYNRDTLLIDSIIIYECSGPLPYDELPDIVFCFGDADCNECQSTVNQIIYDVDQSNLPAQLIPTIPIAFTYDEDSDFDNEYPFVLKVIEYDGGPSGCALTASTNYLITEYGCNIWEFALLDVRGQNTIYINRRLISFSLHFSFT